jgi:hypothetical protein
MLILSALAVFLGSALLFAVQPMVGKRLLPLLGGTPGVWNACMVFFQGVLLVGYLWAHKATRRGGAAAGLPLHAVLMVAACVALPLGLAEGSLPGADDAPVLWLLQTLALMVGLPAVALAATAPMVQLWFSSSRHARAADPYFLYAASNIGSAASLLAFPLVLEPSLSMAAMERAWSWAFGAFAIIVLALGVAVRRNPGPSVAAPEPTAPSKPGDRLAWLGLSALPAALVLASTQHLTTDIASIPLLWIVPLALYLATYVVAFSRFGPRARELADKAMPVVLLLAVTLMALGLRGSVLLQASAHLAALVTVGLLCHGRLAARRPPASGLTAYYFWLALGGVAGGSCVSLLAPVLFDRMLEYPLLLVAACCLRQGAWSLAGGRQLMLDLIAPAVALGAAFASTYWILELPWEAEAIGLYATSWLAVGLIMGSVLILARRGRSFTLALATLCFASPDGLNFDELIHRERTFFGMHEVWTQESDAGTFHLFVNGTTTHGVQFWGEPNEREPISYYGDIGPMGDMMSAARAWERPLDVAVLGLGAGAMALHGQPGWRMVFFEMDPAVVAIARDPELFTCLAVSEAEIEVVVGDGRHELMARDDVYDVIMLDAFSSDSVPLHLLTVEAMEGYMEHLQPGGFLIFNVSNDFLDMAQILAADAVELGLVTVFRSHMPSTPEQIEQNHYASIWVVVTRSRDDIDPEHFGPGWGWITPLDHVRPWTDDFSSLISAMR